MKIRLSSKDMQLLLYLGKYKMMLAVNSRKIYGGKDYYLKRLKILEKEKYIKRISRYIKLDRKGTKVIKECGYEYQRICRRKDYQERLMEIVKIANLTLETTIEFLPSMEMKDEDIFTETSRKYIGELIYQNKKFIVYYISKYKDFIYIRQVINDIQKATNYKYALIFLEDSQVLNKSNKYFMLGKDNMLIIKPNTINLERMKIFQELDFYEILTQIYADKEVLLSNWDKADYMAGNTYIVLMPFIDTEKLHRLNIYYKSNQNQNKKIDIITLKENITKIKEILTNSANIVELDKWLGGIHEQSKKV